MIPLNLNACQMHRGCEVPFLKGVGERDAGHLCHPQAGYSARLFFT
jgi:hypothetical protein